MGGTIKYSILLGLVFFICGSSVSFAWDEIRLEGKWKFRVGDREEWATPDYDDSRWERIQVPSNWEDQGFQGYDGYAWYRLKVIVPVAYETRELMLHLGYIDDVDEVYVNGELVGRTGSFPPIHETAYNAKREYRLANRLIQFGEENLIAVRVYDSQLGGGMVSGRHSIEAKAGIPSFDIELTGEWMFNKGKRINEETAKPILVPGLWENQGFYKYDGYAVYSKKVYISSELAEKQLVMMAGKIDDVDQLYVNGKYVGGMGQFYTRDHISMYREIRNYIIPKKFIQAGTENLIEIRVHDDRWDGGIVEGPVGIFSQDKFRKYWKSKRRN